MFPRFGAFLQNLFSKKLQKALTKKQICGRIYDKCLLMLKKRKMYQKNEKTRKGKTMKLTRFICLLLACSFLVMPLWSCDGGMDDDVDGGGINADGSINWSEVDFKGATVKFSISASQDKEVTFGPADVYLQGPDSVSTDEVLKKVVARNAKIEKDLNIEVEYDTTDLTYDKVLEDIQLKVQGSATDAPDLYNNDMYGLNRAIIAGCLMNLANPLDGKGNEQTSYFNFDDEGWNYEFMQGATFDSNKVYILAGDYYLDMIRMAWVLYVNKTMFNNNASALGAKDANEFYQYVLAGIWDYEMLTDMCSAIWKDTGKDRDKADLEDERVGLAINHIADWIFPAATGLTPFYINEDGKAESLSDIYEYNLMGTAFRDIYKSGGTGEGIYWQQEVLSSTEAFMNGNFLFAQSVLGELESDELRNVSFEKGLVPFPKYDAGRQEEYHTMVHDQTELGAVLVTTRSFARASAFMQYANELSEDVVTEYYEFSLKFKYNEDAAIRGMIDCVYESIDIPFGMQFELIILNYGTGLTPLYEGIFYGSLSNKFDSNKQAYKVALDKALEEFNKLP